MAHQDLYFRARRQASLIAFNAALPENFKLIHKPGTEWEMLPGVHLTGIKALTLKSAERDIDDVIIAPAILSDDIHYNLRVTPDWADWDRLFITDPADPDFNDPDLDKLKLKRWMKNNGVVKLDLAAEHPRTGRTMRWYRWEAGPDWLDISIDEPVSPQVIRWGDPVPATSR